MVTAMAYDWLESHCLAKPGVEKVYKPEWDAVLYRVGGKMFIMEGGDQQGVPIITLKLEPEHGLLARQAYSGVVPGYYMNKEHWNSIYPSGDVPDDAMRAFVDESYALVLGSLSQKLRREIEAGA